MAPWNPRLQPRPTVPDGYNMPCPDNDLRDRLMTPSALKIHLALALLLASAQVRAADPPTAQIAAAERAVAAAERAGPRGQAQQLLDDARRQLAQAKALVADRDYRDALPLAESAAATADLARAQAQLDAAREEVDSKATRNEELRRRLLVLGEE